MTQKDLWYKFSSSCSQKSWVFRGFLNAPREPTDFIAHLIPPSWNYKWRVWIVTCEESLFRLTCRCHCIMNHLQRCIVAVVVVRWSTLGLGIVILSKGIDESTWCDTKWIYLTFTVKFDCRGWGSTFDFHAGDLSFCTVTIQKWLFACWTVTRIIPQPWVF